MVELIQDIGPTRTYSAYVPTPYDLGIEELTRQGYREITASENARLRIQKGRNHFISRNGNWTAEDFNYIPEKGIFLSKVSMISENPKTATECHRRGEDFYLNDEQVQRVLANSISIPSDQKPIPTNRFGEERIPVYLFGLTNGADLSQDEKDAKDYGDFLEEEGINEMPFWLRQISNKPFARKMWFRGLVNGSELVGSNRSLDYYFRVRGVCESAEGTQKFFDYSTKISQALNELGFPELKQGLLAKLLQ